MKTLPGLFKLNCVGIGVERRCDERIRMPHLGAGYHHNAVRSTNFIPCWQLRVWSHRFGGVE